MFKLEEVRSRALRTAWGTMDCTLNQKGTVKAWFVQIIKQGQRCCSL